jgi:phosphoribosylanthranilate isomerase
MSGIQVKICGLTLPEQAEKCFAIGADAVGVVFFERSPRNVSHVQAAEIVDAAQGRPVVAVTVDMEFDALCEINERCGIEFVQLHGNESPEFAARLIERGMRIVKKISAEEAGRDDIIELYKGAAFIVESGEGPLPGGNGIGWNWASSRCLSGRVPFLLAGGITVENLSDAVCAAKPDGVDLSSALESAPGIKDMDKTVRFMERLNIERERTGGQTKRIF